MYYTVIFDGVDICERFDIVLSSFSETPPQPKTFTVDIPTGANLDITDALGAVGYTDGVHKFVFLVSGDDIEERLRGIQTLMNGKRKGYKLSWDAGHDFIGRFSVSDIERLADNAQLVTVTVSRYPWATKVETVDMNAHPTASYTLEGSDRYSDITLKLRQAATVKVGNRTPVQYAAGTHVISSAFYEDTEITITVTNWYYYVDDSDLIVKSDYYTQNSSDVTFTNPPFSVSGTDIECTGESSQHATLTFTRKDL